MSEPTLYREHFTEENEVELGEEGWIYAGTDDEFGILDRWMVPVEPDYEAATAKLIEQGPSDFTDENVARNIIHAAFKGAGIGGDDGR